MRTMKRRLTMHFVQTICWTLALLTQAGTANAVPVIYTFDAVDRGWYNSWGEHDATNKNTLTGEVTVPNTNGYLDHDYYSFFVFDLSTLSKKIRQATLRLELEGYLSDDGTESVTVSDVTASNIPLLGATYAYGSSTGLNIFADLGGGVTLGTSPAVNAPGFGFNLTNTFIEIALNDIAIDAINDAAGGLFAVGLRLNEVSISNTYTQEWLRFSSDVEPRVHQLILEQKAPEPTTLSLLGLGLAGLAATRRRR